MSRKHDQAVEETKRLDAWVQSKPLGDILSALLSLTPEDYEIIGRIIQLMCFIDFNGRRALRALQAAPGASTKTRVQHMQDSQVLSHLREAIANGDFPNEDRAAAKSACDIAHEMAKLRHHLAHWACYRFPRADALIMMTYNAKEGTKRSGLPQEEDQLVYGILPLPELRAKIPRLAEASDVFSELTRTWTLRYVGE